MVAPSALYGSMPYRRGEKLKLRANFEGSVSHEEIWRVLRELDRAQNTKTPESKVCVDRKSVV